MPSPADLPHPGIEPGSPVLEANSLPTEISGNKNPFETHILIPILQMRN